MSAPRSHPLGDEYDRGLLAATPAISKAAKQESYNVDLLEQEQPPPIHVPTRRTTDSEAQYPKESYTNLNSTLPQREKVPWYKTRGGMIALAILAIVIVGAVVGGAVGGSVHKGSNGDSSSNIGTTPSNSTATAIEGSAPSANPSSNNPDGSKPSGQPEPHNRTERWI